MSELMREQVEQYIEQLENWTAFLSQPIRQHLSALRDHDATLRAKLEAVERDNTKWQEIASMRISGDSKWLKEHELLKQQLAAAQGRIDVLQKNTDKQSMRYDLLEGEYHERGDIIDTLTTRLSQVEEALRVAKCPYCDNVGWTAEPDRNTGEPYQAQCQWCAECKDLTPPPRATEPT